MDTNTIEVTQALNFERIERQISDWEDEEPREDWWHWQRDFAAMYNRLASTEASQSPDTMPNSVVEALYPFLRHKEGCPVVGHWMEAAEKECDCGLAATLSQQPAQTDVELQIDDRVSVVFCEDAPWTADWQNEPPQKIIGIRKDGNELDYTLARLDGSEPTDGFRAHHLTKDKSHAE